MDRAHPMLPTTCNAGLTCVVFMPTTVVLAFNRYGGQPCASEEHEHHAGLSDSVFRENILQARFYQQLKAAGLYIHAPDNYYYW